jgi:DNA-binding NarL/FixJ family response regulator
MIEVYSKSKIVKKWISTIENELDNLIEFNHHSTLESLKNELDIKMSLSIAMIDITDSNFVFFTKNYFGQSKHLKFIGIGTKLELEDIKKLVDSNVVSFLEVGNSSIELIKAIKHIKNDQIYFCEQTKDQILNKLILGTDNVLKNSFKSIKYDELNNSTNDAFSIKSNVLALTEKEKKVMQLLVQGLSYKEIANILGVTSFAINQNTKNIYKKLKVKSRSELSYRIFN